MIIIDGHHGVVIINPDEEQLVEHRETEKRRVVVETQLAELLHMPGRTLDGHEVALMANIEVPEGIDEAIDRGAQGVGLYRTEFLYLTRETGEPSEEDHYQAYAESLRRLEGKPLVLRTLDLGADKYTQSKAANPERNPFLERIARSACACTTFRCSSGNCGRSCAPAPRATCASCSP